MPNQDINVGQHDNDGTGDTLRAAFTKVNNNFHITLNQGGTVDALSVPFVSLNAGQQAHVKNDSLWLDETQTLKWKDNTGASVPVIADAGGFDVTLGVLGQQPSKAEVIAIIKNSPGFQDTPAYWGSNHVYNIVGEDPHAPAGTFALCVVRYYGQPANTSEATAGMFFVEMPSEMAATAP